MNKLKLLPVLFLLCLLVCLLTRLGKPAFRADDIETDPLCVFDVPDARAEERPETVGRLLNTLGMDLDPVT